MFGIPKAPGRFTPEEYQRRYLALRTRWPEPFLEHASSVQALLVMAVGVLDKHFNFNGGANWSEVADSEYLDVLRERLLEFSAFGSEEKSKITWALSEIRECGRELESKGESTRQADTAIEILTCRVVDWVVAHPEEMTLKGEDEYLGHY